MSEWAHVRMKQDIFAKNSQRITGRATHVDDANKDVNLETVSARALIKSGAATNHYFHS